MDSSSLKQQRQEQQQQRQEQQQQRQEQHQQRQEQQQQRFQERIFYNVLLEDPQQQHPSAEEKDIEIDTEGLIGYSTRIMGRQPATATTSSLCPTSTNFDIYSYANYVKSSGFHYYVKSSGSHYHVNNHYSDCMKLRFHINQFKYK
jgi:type II secretory pathway pseudopilin PulG